MKFLFRVLYDNQKYEEMKNTLPTFSCLYPRGPDGEAMLGLKNNS